MSPPAHIDALLEELIGRRLGHAPGNWPRKLYDFVERASRSKGQTAVAWLQRLRGSPNAADLEALLAAATIGHTAFFRHPEQFAELRRVLSNWPAQQQRSLQLWSVGCSTGEEPYSMALCAYKLGIRVRILATDVNPQALEVARVGRYERGPGPDFSGTGGEWTAPHELRQVIRFEEASLVTDPLPHESGPFDLIFCRNVLIYFPRHHVPAVLEAVAGQLKPQGALVVSPSDAVLPIPDCLSRGEAPGWLCLAHPPPPSVRVPPPKAPTASAQAPSLGEDGAVEDLEAGAPTPIDRAAQLLGSGQAEEAEALLTELLNSAPDDIEGWFLLGESLLQRGEATQARAAFIRASRCSATASAGIDASALRWAAVRRAQALLDN
jgi:chemotaxis protein methyltransferase CheR